METVFSMIWLALRLIGAWLILLALPGRKWYARVAALSGGWILMTLVARGFVLGLRTLFGLPEAELARRVLFSLAARNAGQLLGLLAVWTALRLRARRGNLKWIGLTLVFPALSTLMLLLIFRIYLGRNDISDTTFFFCCTLSFSNIAVAALVRAVEKSTQRNQELALLHKQLIIQSESIISLEKSYRAQRQATHDYRNQLQTIHRLLTTGEQDAAREYTRQLLDVGSTRLFSIHSGHPIVDAVVHQKYQTAQENGIDMTVQVNDLSGLSMNTNEIVVLLSNLLDNAIEGCLRCGGEKRVQCSIILDGGLFLSIRNTAPPVEWSRGTIPTTKEPKAEHGFGLRTIRHILAENGGEHTFRWENGWFEFAAEIPQPGKEEDHA